MQKPILWIISELFPPEETSTSYIFGEIANAMVHKYTVKVICGPEVYDSDKKIDLNNKFHLHSSIEVFRIEGISENKRSVLSRVRKFLGMTYRLYKVSKHYIKDGDKVLLATNPFPLVIPMAKLRRKRKFFLMLLVHDIFPEPLAFRMKLPSIVYNSLYKMFGKAYSGCDLLFSIGRDMTDLLREKTNPYNFSQKIALIENWGDVVNIHPITRPKELPHDRVVIQYAGNIGEAQGVQQFVRHLSNSKAKGVLFSIWGTGTAEDQIKEMVDRLELKDNVEFNGPYFRSQQTDVLNACDIALVSLRDIIKGIGVPSKSYNIMAAGKPILFIGPLDSEIALMIRENQIGYCFDEYDSNGIEAFLQSMDFPKWEEWEDMGKRARIIVEKKYSKEAIIDKFNTYM